jgi:hypothetical protein
MVGTIGPVVHGRTRSDSKSWPAWYVAAHVAGACATGLVVALLGRAILPRSFVSSRGVLVPLFVISVATAAREFGLVNFPIPSSGWQVPRIWSLGPTSVMARRYGLILGTAITTKVLHSSLYVALAASFLMADPLLGMAAMATYGLMRALAVFAVIYSCRDVDELHERNFAVANYWQVVKLLNGVALVAMAAHFSLLLMLR